MKSFYVFLPSNVKDYLNRNRISHYITKLPTTLHLEGEWSVGLAEILFTRSWYNISRPQTLSISDGHGNEFKHPDATLPAGFYDSTFALVTMINKYLEFLFNTILDIKTKGTGKPPHVSFDEISRRITIHDGNMQFIGESGGDFVELSFNLPYDLHNMLGFSESKLSHQFNGNEALEATEDIKVRRGTRDIDINAGLHALYVYTDIIKPSFVGDSFAQLLRVIQLENTQFGGTVQKIFNPPHYFPLTSREFQTVEIQIKDDTGELISFEEGRVIVVLHFKNESV